MFGRSLAEVNIRIKHGLISATLLALLLAAPIRAMNQAPQPTQAPRQTGSETPGEQNGPAPSAGGRRVGGFVPGKKRPPGDPVQIGRGKTLYGINCRGCHGADLRGGDLGGPNLLRSQVALSDQNGELIVPIIEGSRQSMGMPAIGLSPADANAVAAYVRSVVDTIQSQGAPPSLGREAPSVLVGNASEGKAYFAAKCSGCHSASGDLSKIAERIPDPKRLQNTWVAGGTRGNEGESVNQASSARTVTATITLPSGERVGGKLVRIDDFLVTLQFADGSERTFRRNGDVPKVVIRDPLKAHRDLLAQYSDRDIHDVTAYLVTLN
ncbi:MAG: c-type cytochrome [Bryobacteraceae bacterium]